MSIRTTRLKQVQLPKTRTIDLSSQMNGITQTFAIGRLVSKQDIHHLVWNSTVYRNTPARKWYSLSEGGTLTTYFDQAPKGGAQHSLLLVISDFQGESPTVTQEELDQAIGSAIEQATAMVSGEKEEREAADEELRKSISDETKARENSVSILENKILSEAEERDAKDTILENKIDEEKSVREAKDAELESKIDNEVSDRETAVSSLKSDLEAKINAEESARSAKDDELQTQIDAAINATDVRDVVGTKAELNSYPTAGLGDNDIIKVLADESRDGATTYYRYTKATSTFNLIGAIGPYYTKVEADKKIEEATKEAVEEAGGQAEEEVAKKVKEVKEEISKETDKKIGDAKEELKGEIESAVENKQDKLESGVNVKTINGESILGPGNIEIEAGSTVESITSDEFNQIWEGF